MVQRKKAEKPYEPCVLYLCNTHTCRANVCWVEETQRTRIWPSKHSFHSTRPPTSDCPSLRGLAPPSLFRYSKRLHRRWDSALRHPGHWPSPCPTSVDQHALVGERGAAMPWGGQGGPGWSRPSDADPTRKLATAKPAVPKKRVVVPPRARALCTPCACPGPGTFTSALCAVCCGDRRAVGAPCLT